MTKSILGKQTQSLIETVNLKSVNSVINTTSTISSSGNSTITAAQLLSGHIFRTGFAGSIVDTVGPTATDIVNAIPNCKVGDTFMTTVYSWPTSPVTVGSILHTLQEGTGISNRMNIPNVAFSSSIGAQFVTLKFVITNVTSPSVVMHRISNVTQTGGAY